MRLNLWSSPRNISTALMYSFAQRPDTTVVDEPLYAHYLRHQPTEAEHPGKAEILATMENDGSKVVQQLVHDDFGRTLVVFKQMTHHLVAFSLADEVAILGLENDEIGNVLLIRDPAAIIASFSKVVDLITAEDIGLPQQYALFQRLRAANKLTAVLDSRKLLQDPEGVLRRLSEKIGLPFYPAMLSWLAGQRPEDGCWAKYWYANVHQSTGFKPYTPKSFKLSDELRGIAEEVMPLYEEMLVHSL